MVLFPGIVAATLRPATSRRTQPAGFSLLETLVALSLLAIALLFTMALIAQEARLEKHLTAHTEVLDVLDTLYEQIRAGATLPEGTTNLDWQRSFEASFVLSQAEDLSITLDVESLPLSDLYQVTLRARYAVAQRPFERSVQTLAWRP